MRPREWVRRLEGTELASIRPSASAAVDVGLYRFGDLPERLTLPPIDAHYISFTLTGSLRIERDLGDGREEADFRRGSSLIMASGQVNTWRWDRPTDELHLYVDPAYLAAVAAEAEVGVPAVIDRFAFDDPFLRQAAIALLDARRRPAIAGQLFADCTSHLVALHLLRAHCAVARREPRTPGGLGPAQLRRVRDLVESDLARPLTLAELAAAAGVTRFHFARAFRRSTGTSPHRYVLGRRIERARTLLAATDVAVAEIAAEVGFATASHFGHAFRRAIGVSPTEYRRRARS